MQHMYNNMYYIWCSSTIKICNVDVDFPILLGRFPMIRRRVPYATRDLCETYLRAAKSASNLQSVVQVRLRPTNCNRHF